MNPPIRLLLDEMLGPKLAAALRELETDVYGIVERADLRGLPDELVLDLAARDSRVLVTCNIADFIHLDQKWRAESRSHAGIVLVPDAAFPQDRSWIGALTRSLAHAADQQLMPGPDQVSFLSRHT